MSKLFAQIDGPGGACITSSRWSKSEEMHISFRVDYPEVDINKPESADARQELGRYILQLQSADHWLARMSFDRTAMTRQLASIEREHSVVDASIGDSIRKLYDDRLLREIDDRMFRSMAPLADPIPVAFNKQKLMEVVAEARAAVDRAGLNPVDRWMIAVESEQEVWKMFPQAKPDDDPNVVYPADQVRAPRQTPEGGTYGLFQGLRVMIDPSIEGWELRDQETGDKIQFVENPDEPNVWYYFDGSKSGHIKTWPRGGVNDGS